MSHTAVADGGRRPTHAGGAASYEMRKANGSVLQGGLEDSVFTKVIMHEGERCWVCATEAVA